LTVTYRFRILTPSRQVLDEDIVSMVAPGAAGYLGVLANHAPLLTTLMRGILTVKTDQTEKSYRIDGGILRVAGNSAVLLSEEVEEVTPEPR